MKKPRCAAAPGLSLVIEHVSYANCDAPQGYGDFCLMGNDDPSLIISCPQPHASDWKHRKVLHGA